MTALKLLDLEVSWSIKFYEIKMHDRHLSLFDPSFLLVEELLPSSSYILWTPNAKPRTRRGGRGRGRGGRRGRGGGHADGDSAGGSGLLLALDDGVASETDAEQKTKDSDVDEADEAALEEGHEADNHDINTEEDAVHAVDSLLAFLCHG